MPSQSKSRTSTTQTRNVAPMTAQEALLQARNQQAAMAQAAELQRAIQAQQALEQSPGYLAMQGIGGQAATGLQGLMANGMMPSGAQQQALQQYFQSIMAPQLQQMQDVTRAEAARRGMTIADSPIGNPFLQSQANYRAQMGGQQAGQALQLGQNLANQYQNALNFGQSLQNSAAQNRLALAQARPGSYDFGQQLAQNRIQSAPTTMTQTSSQQQPFAQTLGQYGQAAEGAGSLLFGKGANKRTGMGGLTGFFGLGGT